MNSGKLIIWLLITYIPWLGVGIFFGFYPHKVIKIIAKIQEKTLKSQGLTDKDIDRLPFYSTIYGDRYSNVLKSQQDNPRESRFLMMWIRVIGFLLLLSGLLTLGITILAALKGIIRETDIQLLNVIAVLSSLLKAI